MSRTVETSRIWPALVPLGQTGRQRRVPGGARDAQHHPDAAPRSATGGVLLRWGPSQPMPRVLHARSVPVRPPDVWCVGQERGIARGSSVFLLHTGPAPGLVARGVVSRAPFIAAREDRIGTVGQHIGVEWQELHSLTTRIPLDVLVAAVPDWRWLPGEASGVVLPADLLECVERVWMQWHHKPQRGHRVADWVRESWADTLSATMPHSDPGGRHRRLAAAAHALHPQVRSAV